VSTNLERCLDGCYIKSSQESSKTSTEKSIARLKINLIFPQISLKRLKFAWHWLSSLSLLIWRPTCQVVSRIDSLTGETQWTSHSDTGPPRCLEISQNEVAEIAFTASNFNSLNSGWWLKIFFQNGITEKNLNTRIVKTAGVFIRRS